MIGQKVLITGATGFIGKHLKAEFIRRGYQVEEFNRSDGEIEKSNLNFKKIQHVFHLAAKSFVPDSWKNPKQFYETNVIGTTNVLDYCRASGAGLTFVSSYVYGIPQSLPINEIHPTFPFNPYAHSKIISENICDFYQKNFNLNTTIVRPFNAYGSGQDKRFLIPEIIEQLFDKTVGEIQLLDLKPKRDYIFVHDIASAIIGLFENNKTGIYNVGSGYSLSVEEIVKTIMKVTGIEKPYTSKEENRKNEIPDVIADISKIQREINWKPSYSFEQGIAEIIKRQNNS